ncbi:MAG: recombinase family protein, partial [Microvirga sp.]
MAPSSQELEPPGIPARFMILAAYVRVSTQRQAQSQATDQQIERLQAYALAQGADLRPEHLFRDDGY